MAYKKVTRDVIAHDIAKKAASQWTAKAAKALVEAQEIERSGYALGCLVSGKSKAEHAARVRDDAAHAEKMAREWTAKANKAMYPVTDVEVFKLIDKLPKAKRSEFKCNHGLDGDWINRDLCASIWNECVDALNELEPAEPDYGI